MAKKKNSISEQSLKIGSPEIGMLGKNDFSEDELEALAGGATRIMQGLEEGREY